jgi:AcrR family transcriptional regulator
MCGASRAMVPSWPGPRLAARSRSSVWPWMTWTKPAWSQRPSRKRWTLGASSKAISPRCWEASRLGVVPGAVYRHIRNKQQLQDLVLDGVLAEIDFDLDPSLKWSEQLKALAHRLAGCLLPAGRLHHRLRRQQHLHRRQRATPPRPSDQDPAAPVLPLAAPRPLPRPVALGEHVWVDNRDERFTAGLDVLVAGLEHGRKPPPPGGARRLHERALAIMRLA